MAILKDGQFELDGYVFGGRSANSLWVSNYKIGAPKRTDTNAQNPVGNNTLFGRSFLSGPDWEFEMAMLTGDENTALAGLETAMGIWYNEVKYEKPETEAILRYARGGRTRRVYGRPKDFEFDTNGFLVNEGSWDAKASFQAADPLYYDDVERVAVLQLRTPTEVKITLPNVFPWMHTPSAEQTAVIDDVGGTVNAPMRIVVSGPIADFIIRGDGWYIQMIATLAAGESVTIDTRKMTVLKNNGVSLAGALTRGSTLRNARLRPGQDNFKFQGIDTTGTARCSVYWRPTYRGL